jgi:hypothetical protein
MARPKKLSTDEMLQIVDSYFENCGDPGRLKCSFLEIYAASLGIEAKAYNFRRDAAVRQHMEELRGSVKSDEIGAIVYKTMDVDAMLNRNYTREMMKNSLLELDETWRRIYVNASDLSRKNMSLLSEISSLKKTSERISEEKETLEVQAKSADKKANALIVEIRYLKKMINAYLYPAIANEILKGENVLEQIDTRASPEAMAALAESSVPASFSSSIADDVKMLSREELLLGRINQQIHDHSR